MYICKGATAHPCCVVEAAYPCRLCKLLENDIVLDTLSFCDRLECHLHTSDNSSNSLTTCFVGGTVFNRLCKLAFSLCSSAAV